MCGIWGVIGKKNYGSKELYRTIKDLFLFSESRGKEAAGIAFLYGNKIVNYKKPIPASAFVDSPEYDRMLKKYFAITNENIAVIGHSRLVTNGIADRNQNNQPVNYGRLTTVHNGIIVNSEELWKVNPHLCKESDLDTEIFVKICEFYHKKGVEPKEAIRKTFSCISGMTSVLTFFSDSRKLLAATNNGSLYYWTSRDKELVLFASEEHMFRMLYKKNRFVRTIFDMHSIIHLNSCKGVDVDIDVCKIESFSLPVGVNIKMEVDKYGQKISIINHKFLKYDIDIEPIKKIKRCTKCVLPETMPYIEFDEDGVCNYCKKYQKMKYLGETAMIQTIEGIKSRNYKNEYNAVVSFSGGRDSSYGLHYFVKELGIKPVAYNYDWGMVTDLARRNQSRMCAALGVELITISADIRKKRENIRKNIVAWIKRPDLGLIPLFMAGDKAFYYYANLMKKRIDVDCILLASNPFETTYFKTAYCGVVPSILRKDDNELDVERLSIADTTQMAVHYIKEYMTNWKYINSSIVDTALATASYYLIPHDYFRLYNYIPWDENVIDDVLINKYGWEKAIDTDSTWRIGDGTAPFYNYIYYLICGFTENDTLRSNQIREGKLKRDKALELVYSDNRPRWESLEWYFDTVGLDMELVLDRVNNMRRLYLK